MKIGTQINNSLMEKMAEQQVVTIGGGGAGENAMSPFRWQKSSRVSRWQWGGGDVMDEATFGLAL